MIGNTAYCLDPKTKKIFTAKIVGNNVSETGYELIRLLKSDNTTISLEKARVYATKQEVEEHKARVIPLLEEADKVQKEAVDKLNAIRIQVIGEPTYKDLADKIKGK